MDSDTSTQEKIDPNAPQNGHPDEPSDQVQKGAITFLAVRLQAVFLKGLFTLLPILLTAFLVAWAVGSLEKTFGEPFLALLPEGLYVPGLGIVMALFIILAAGFLVENYLASKVLNKLEAYLKRAPGIRSIYSPLKDLTDLFGRAKGPQSGRACPSIS